MICTSKVYIPIYGEVNVLRHLSRIGPSDLNYEKSSNPNESDSILDLCYQLVHNQSPKERQSFVKSLSNRLGKEQFYGNGNFSIADVAVSSTFKQLRTVLGKEVTPNLTKWLDNASKIYGY